MTLYDWLLAIYPRAFRDKFGAGMRAAFAEDYQRSRARGTVVVLRFLTTTVLHALWFGIIERLPRPATVQSFLAVDLRDAVRSLVATPVVTAVGVISLALGIGANTALFSILNSLVLRQLPVRDPQQLVVIARGSWTNPIWEQIRDRQSDLFESAFAWSAQQFNLSGSARADLVEGAYVSGGMFHTLGLDPILGRPLIPADDVRGGGRDGHAAMISYRFWQQRYGGAQDVLGRRLTLNRVPFTIVGVTPASFLGPEVGRAMDVFVPLASDAAIRGSEYALDNRSAWWLDMIIRLDANQTLEAAAAALNAVRPMIRDATLPRNLKAEFRDNYLKDAFTLMPAATGVSRLRNRFATPLTIIMIVVAAVLLIACANIANLMLARASARHHEMSVRLALGASRARLGCQMFAESLLLAAAGGIAGLAMAKSCAALLVRQLGSERSSVTLDLSIDWRVLGFTAAIALGATLAFGLAPALGLSGVAPNDALKEQRRTVAGDRRVGLRTALVVAQIAVSFVLVAGAGLFGRTFTALATTPLGFDPAKMLIVQVDVGRGNYALEKQTALCQRLTETAVATPGVSRASLSPLTPMGGRGWNDEVQVTGGPTLSRREQSTWVNAVTPGWFETYGMRVRAGRDVAASDVAAGEPVAVVDEAFVRRFVGQQNPLGQRISGLGVGDVKSLLIVGVVNDALYQTARAGVHPTMYLPVAQAGAFGSTLFLTVKLAADRQSVERSLTNALSRVDPNLTLVFRDYSDQVRATLVQERLIAMLASFFVALAMLLAGLGLYGVTSFAVGRRRPEIAVRMALGASAGGVVRLVLRNVATLLVVGAGIGLGLSLWVVKFVGPLLFQVDARDPIILATAASTLIAVGLFAGWLPARRGARVDPTTVLRV